MSEAVSKDSLRRFLETATGNTAKVIAAQPRLYRKLRDIDAVFHRLNNHLDNPSSPIGAVFSLDCHSKFLGGCLLAVCGQLPETYLLVRACLEASLYALYFEKHEDMRDVWMEREDSDDARRRLRRELTRRALLDEVSAHDRHLSRRIAHLYEDAIRLGAHPNPWAVAGSLMIEETEHETSYVRKYLGGRDVEIAATQKQLAVGGISALEVFVLVFPERSGILGIPEGIAKLKQSL